MGYNMCRRREKRGDGGGGGAGGVGGGSGRRFTAKACARVILRGAGHAHTHTRRHTQAHTFPFLKKYIYTSVCIQQQQQKKQRYLTATRFRAQLWSRTDSTILSLFFYARSKVPAERERKKCINLLGFSSQRLFR